MNESLLKEIYFNCESLGKKIKPNGEHERLKKESEEYYDKLFGMLGEEPKKWLDEIWMLEWEMKSEWGYTNFQAGLKIGLRLMAKAFTEPISELSSNLNEKTPPEEREG